MKKILASAALEHKFVKGLKEEPGVKIYRRSATWKNWHADSGVIVHEDYRYIVVALSQLPNDGEKLNCLASAVDALMKRHYGVS